MLVQLNTRPEKRQLRQFGWVALVAFAGLGCAAYFWGELFRLSLGDAATALAYSFWTLGALSAVFALVWPEGNRPLFVALAVAAFPIGWVVSHIVLVIVFYGILTPVGLFFRLLGRDPLERAFDPDRESYWVDLPESTDKSDYFHQF